MKKVGKTDVSVIMPVYNTEPYLREALDSLLKTDESEYRNHMCG